MQLSPQVISLLRVYDFPRSDPSILPLPPLLFVVVLSVNYLHEWFFEWVENPIMYFSTLTVGALVLFQRAIATRLDDRPG